MTSSLILTNIPYNFFNKEWLIKSGIEAFVWEMYEEFATDKDYEPIPRWDYFIEDENPLTTFYDEVISYLAFQDFDHYQYLENEEQYNLFVEKMDEHGCEIDEDFMHLFDEMRLSMTDTAGEYIHFPIVQVW